MGGPNLLLAARFVAPSALTVTAAEVFTGEGTGTNTVAIWTHVAATNAPGVLLASGSWVMSSTNSWQGAALATPVSLSAGATYWFVWGCVNGSQASIDLPSTTAIAQPYRGSTNAGASWTGPFQSAARPWKFRVTCGTPGWQTNQLCSSLVAGGVVSGGTSAAITVATVGAPTTVDFGGSAGLGFDLLLTANAPMYPNFYLTPGGQIFNLDFTHPSLTTLLGSSFVVPFAPFSTPVTLTTPATEVEAQLVILLPTSPDGFCLSQAAALRTL